MEATFIERRHANGMIARVTYFGRARLYQASRHASGPGVGIFSSDVEAGYGTLAMAQRAADRLAHPGCRGNGCEPWPADDPRRLGE